MQQGFAITVDIGKTVAKLGLWSREGRLIDRVTRPNTARAMDGVARLDADGIAEWLVAELAAWASHPIAVIVPVAHGAAFAALAGGKLAFAPLDYEAEPPPALLAAYRAARDPFAITGSPPLPAGLNFGAQIAWGQALYPAQMASATLLPWAQYWAWFLSGAAVSEVTTLGCHSDLWAPAEGDFSPMAKARGWAARFAPMARAADTIGMLRPELARATGLSPSTRVLAGLHDSNAALLASSAFAEMAGEATILSTGTWFIAMRRTESPAHALPEGRDCLVNVDIAGRPVPSARFMGGREIDLAAGVVDTPEDQPAQLAAIPALLREGTLLLPTLAPGCGPFPDGAARWIAEPAAGPARRAAACLYAALVADAALEGIGARETLLIEGRFAQAQVFTRALAALRPHTRVFTASGEADVSFGALKLAAPGLKPQGQLTPVAPLAEDIAGLHSRWRAAMAKP